MREYQKLTMEDKRRIAARMFYQDNPDQYEDYREALSEFIGGDGQSDTFIEFCVRPVIKTRPNHYMLTNSDGHVITLRVSDNLLNPITEMSQEYGESIEELFESTTEKFPELDELECLQKMGWKLFISDSVKND